MKYVILRHARPNDIHWDLLLTQPGADLLRTFALSTYPIRRGWTSARALPPHRPLYLTYQGPVISVGGSVQRVDQGQFTVVADSPTELRLLLRSAASCCLLELRTDNISSHRWRVRRQ